MFTHSSNVVIPTPWDSLNFGFKTFEINFMSEDDLKIMLDKILRDQSLGHYTIKTDPLMSKKIFHDYGFYYCDTLLEPFCNSEHLIIYSRDGIHISESVEDINELIKISHGLFSHGRFHRDFNINKDLANVRYDLWLEQLWRENKIFSLNYFEKLVGFFAYSDDRILLHGLGKEYQGQGLAKYFWSLACQKLFSKGYTELKSSISASNIPVVNLYSSMGFRFRKPIDVYHFFLQ
jgi:GNAT superfamily N-acetyltransferase